MAKSVIPERLKYFLPCNGYEGMEALTLRQGLRLRQAELGAYVGGNNLQKVIKISAVSAGVVLLLGVSMFYLRGLGTSKFSNNPVPVAIASDSGSPTIPQLLGVTIANNGYIFVRGARVTAVSGNTIEASVFWGSTDFPWVIKTSGVTKFLNHQGQKQTISNIQVGDTVTVTGNLVSDSNKFIINAEFVRE